MRHQASQCVTADDIAAEEDGGPENTNPAFKASLVGFIGSVDTGPALPLPALRIGQNLTTFASVDISRWREGQLVSHRL